MDLAIAGTECQPFSKVAEGALGYVDDRARMVPAVVQNIHHAYATQGRISYIIDNVPNVVNYSENTKLMGDEYVLSNGVQLGSQKQHANRVLA